LSYFTFWIDLLSIKEYFKFKMFKHAFHGGPAVEILSTSGKNPLEKWKTSGTIAKSFDSALKSYIYNLDG